MRRHVDLGRAPSRSWVALFLLTALVGCGRKQPADEIAKTQGALLPDETTPIGQKWRQLVNKGVAIGEATNLVQTVPGSSAQYQPFVDGVIVYSNDHGAVYITQAIFDRWQALTTTFNVNGAPVYPSFGLPTGDYRHTADHDEATFEGGIVFVKGGDARVVYGDIYLKYLSVNRLVLGLPTSEEATTSVFADARFQTFEGGNIYWKLAAPGPFFVQTPLLIAFELRGGLAVAGMPTSDTSAILVPGGAPGTGARGLASRFTNMGFYQNLANGKVFDVDSAVFTEYERQGGPNGWLGLPTSSMGFSPVSGFQFNDFEGGVLVWYEPTKVAAFGDMQFYLERVTAHGNDCGGCGAQDLVYFVDVVAEGTHIVNQERHPSTGDFGTDTDNFHGGIGPIVVAADHATTFTATVNVWDRDVNIIFGNNSDPLGTVTQTFTIDNLWGMLPGGLSPTWVGDAEVDCTIKTSHAFQENDFRGQKYWSFQNFKTPHLTYFNFADTFEDVSPDEDAFFNPFNRFYYDYFYESVAAGGNCSGMNVQQIYASRGQSRIGMPIHDAQFSSPGVVQDINVRHGAQLGIAVLAWRAQQWTYGKTTNFGSVYNDSLAFFNAGDPPMLSIYADEWYGKAHSLLPYAYPPGLQPCLHVGGTQCARILVADPNFPTMASEVVNADGTRASDRFVEISSDGSEYFYDGGVDQDGNPVIYKGGTFTGARMLVEPASVLLENQVTPFDEPYLIASSIFMMVVGQSGATQQITDASGRTYFEPGLGGVPTRWDQIRHDAAMRVPNIAPSPSSDGSGANSAQLWLGQGSGATHTYDIAAKPGVAPGTYVEAEFHAGTMSSRFQFPSTAGKPDQVIAHEINTANRAISFAVPAGSVAKAIKWTVAGTEKQRWMEFSNLGMSPAQAIKMQSANGGRRLLLDNNGPATSAHLNAKGGPGSTVVDRGMVAIPTGSSSIDLGGLKTTLTTSGAVNGSNGWLVAPVTITLTTQDLGGAGIAVTQYSSDGVNWTAYTAPFQYATEGTTTIYYRAQDKDGNIEPTNSQVFKIDMQLPATTGSIDTTAGVKLTYAVTDPLPGSGVQGVNVVQGGGSPTFTAQASGTITLAGTCSAVEFWGVDVAGNATSPHLVNPDTVKPVFTTVPPATVTSNSCTVAQGLNIGTAAATDDCSGTITVTNNAPARFPLGVTVVTWTAIDAAGNVATKTTTVITELGDSTACCPVGSNIILGTSNNDTLNGTSGVDCILGFNGQDVIHGNGGADAISGGGGDDDIWGGDGNDWIGGGAGQDKLRGENGNDILSGGDGDDWLWGGNNDDLLLGGMQQDQLLGEAGNDILNGDQGFDTLNGGTGNDFLRGGTEIDSLAGGGGIDQCVQDGADNLSACTAVAP